MAARLGQHFLTDEAARDAIVAAAGLEAGSRVLEIGPGRGFLTKALLAEAKLVAAVELDERLAGALPERLGAPPHLRVVRADFLKLDLAELGEGPFVVVANLPYAVATPILQRLLAWPRWQRAVLMFQKEVAQRIAAEPGSGKFGLLTLSVLLRAEPELILEVPREGFSPKPEVASAVVRLARRPAPLLPEVEEAAFFRVAKAAFAQRRKMAAGPVAAALGIPREKAAEALARCGLAPNCRAEEIPFSAWLRLPMELGA